MHLVPCQPAHCRIIELAMVSQGVSGRLHDPTARHERMAFSHIPLTFVNLAHSWQVNWFKPEYYARTNWPLGDYDLRSLNVLFLDQRGCKEVSNFRGMPYAWSSS